MKEYYKILGLTEDATDEEIEVAYKTLKSKYQNEMFLEGEKGNEAAQKLTKIQIAYNEIISSKKEEKEEKNKEELKSYKDIEYAIKNGDLNLAQSYLDEYTLRDAEWHYLQSIVYYRKNWTNESKKQLEIALSKDPDNPRYKNAYDKFEKVQQKSSEQFKSGSYSGYSNDGNQQMGNTDCCTTCNDCCTAYCVASVCTNCCCR